MPALWSFVGGMVVGVVLGISLERVLGGWLAWQEWKHASREALLADQMLSLLDASDSEQRHKNPERTAVPGSEASSG